MRPCMRSTAGLFPFLSPLEVSCRKGGVKMEGGRQKEQTVHVDNRVLGRLDVRCIYKGNPWPA